MRNARIKRAAKVGEICKKVQESGLKWYGHACMDGERREEEYVCGPTRNVCMVMEVYRGKEGEEGQLGSGWISMQALSKRKLSEEEAQDRVKRSRLRSIDSVHINTGKDAEEESV